MSKRLVTYVILVAMTLSVFYMPVLSYGEEAVAENETTESEAKEEAAGEVVDEGNHVASETAPAPVELKQTSGVKAKAVSYQSIRISWKKVANASGYQVFKYSKKKKKYVKVKTTKSAKTLKYKSTALGSNKKYKYKVRAVKTTDGKTYYGKYSKPISAKTKKTGRQKVVDKAKTKIGAAYRYGASGPKAFDCSGFVYWVYKDSKIKKKKRVPRTSSAGLYLSLKKYKVASGYKGIKKAKKGDIILFKRGGRYSHAAIYAGNGKIIHARTPAKGVMKQSVRQLHNSGTRVATIIRVAKK